MAARLFVFSAMLLALAGPLAAEPLITGSATYEIDLDPSRSVNGANGISGEMTMSLTRSCTAYRTDATIDLTFSAPTGRSATMNLRSILVEDGNSLNFDVDGRMGGIVIERSEGIARKTDDGLAVSFSAPEGKTFAAHGPVLFPIAVIEAALDAAKAGKTFAQFQVFDGSGGGEEVWTMSVVITPVPASEDFGEEALFPEGLGFESMDRWRMKFSYFRSDGGIGDQTPAFSTEAVVYANGFALATIYDLGGAAVRLKLIDFSPVEPKPC